MQRAGRFLSLRVGTMEDGVWQQRTQLLAQCEAFASIAHSELRLLATMFEPLDLAVGEWLCHEGEPANHVYLVESGELEVLHESPDQRLMVVGPGHLTGEYGLFLGRRRTAALRSLQAARVLRLDYERFEQFLVAFPQSLTALLRQAIETLLVRDPGLLNPGRDKPQP